MPGRLSVSRTFGDCLAKLEQYGGNPKVIICDPEILTFEIGNSTDYILIGSDGVFDKLSNEDIHKVSVQTIWKDYAEYEKKAVGLQKGSFEHITHALGAAVDAVITKAMDQDSTDNLSVIVLGFKNLANAMMKNCSSTE